MTPWLQLAAAGGEAAEGGHVVFHLFGLPVHESIVTMWILMALIIVLGIAAARGLHLVPRNRFQMAVQWAVESLYGFVTDIMGRERARQFTPLLGSFFVLILLSNYTGLLPLLPHENWFQPPTSRWGVTGGLAIFTFVAVQVYGFRRHGLGYFRRFLEGPVFLWPLTVPLAVIEELIKPFSLSLRLFANIFGGEAVLAGLLAALPWFLPMGVMFIEVIAGFVQALIFTMMSALYIEAATAEFHHEH
ncbi:F0F1 ATP synthase subunit A [Thermaerobacter subterraneus]|uniref:ATP synthase subunit a n=1 Tax=Thermaerobacter subterraneus DSM 13965 TaxID=867903 RepID=K6P0N4_9FIRM|nr:F0F1 ATP synthase subunit A [Thermaerobacter subterraneus]EKP94665.1 F0F1-type ATP synthase, alpha subunit [Thermaerobacter subterraneus DSM 13965]